MEVNACNPIRACGPLHAGNPFVYIPSGQHAPHRGGHDKDHSETSPPGQPGEYITNMLLTSRTGHVCEKT